MKSSRNCVEYASNKLLQYSVIIQANWEIWQDERRGVQPNLSASNEAQSKEASEEDSKVD